MDGFPIIVSITMESPNDRPTHIFPRNLPLYHVVIGIGEDVALLAKTYYLIPKNNHENSFILET